MDILYAVLILLGLGLVFGFILAVAAKVLHVKEDKRIEEVAKRLPNYNCGACGYAGCKDMAEAFVKGTEPNIKKCKPGKDDTNFNPILAYMKEHPNAEE